MKTTYVVRGLSEDRVNTMLELLGAKKAELRITRLEPRQVKKGSFDLFFTTTTENSIRVARYIESGFGVKCVWAAESTD